MKKISIPIIVIIIAVVLIVVLVKGLQEQPSKLLKIYNKISTSQTYAFTRYDLEEKNKRIIYKKEDKTLIDEHTSGEHVSTLVVDGDTYLISHKNKEYFVYLNNNLDAKVLTDKLKNIVNLEYVTGKEKIYGKSYKYEEYKGVSEFLISSENNIELSSAVTRFYFKGNQLVYLKTIYNVVDEQTGEKNQKEELQTVKIEYEVDEKIFEIPSDYAEN